MTATAIAPPAPSADETIGVANVVRSEWTKLRTVRSTYWTAFVAVLAGVGIAILSCAEFVHNFARDQVVVTGIDAVSRTSNGLYAAQIALGALGVLTITGEYATGMIRTTLTAVPQRRAVVAVKGLVFGLAVLVIGEIMSFAAFGIGQAILNTKHFGVSLSDPGVARVVVGGGLYLTAVGMLAFGLGALFRRTAGALASFFGVLFLPSALIDLLPQSWHAAAMKFAPANAGTQILNLDRQHGMLGPWSGLGMLALYAAIILALALFLLGRRDA
jgi:hypothetical protein